MSFQDIISDLLIDTKGLSEGFLTIPSPTSSLGLFYPEIWVCVTIIVMLLVRICDVKDRINSFYVALAGTIVAFYSAAPWMLLAEAGTGLPRIEIFTGLLVVDSFTVFMRGILLLFTLLFLVFTWLSGLPGRDDSTDIYSLVLGAVLGMMLMVSTNHLLMLFIAVEMASVPSFVLAGMLKGRKLGSEAALKFSVYGAGAAGVMLYGISLIAGLTNTVHLPTVAYRLATEIPNMSGPELMALALGGLLLSVGLAFKLSAVPFHFWAPDVFEGAAAEVGAFLSVASKAAALALLVRVAMGVGTYIPDRMTPVKLELARAAATAEANEANVVAAEPAEGLFRLAEEHEDPRDGAASGTVASENQYAAIAPESLAPVRNFTAKFIAFLAILTCTFGNLAAYGQTNIKRLLAYSTIAHAGYMMMALPPMIALSVIDVEAARFALAALSTYIFVYLFMNLGAFAVVAFLRNSMRSEEVADYGGLIRCCPTMTVCFSLILFSLIGLPPLAGFIGKFAVFAALAEGYRQTFEPYLMVVLLAGGINTAISLVYYMWVVKVMTFDPEPDSRTPIHLGFLPVGYVAVITLPILGLIITWDTLHSISLAAARQLLS